MAVTPSIGLQKGLQKFRGIYIQGGENLFSASFKVLFHLNIEIINDFKKQLFQGE